MICLPHGRLHASCHGRWPSWHRYALPGRNIRHAVCNDPCMATRETVGRTHDVGSARASLHVEPRGARATAQHYLKDVVYGANDGLITTFAVVAGVEGGALTHRAVLVVGFANLVADGLSMGVGNYLSIRSQEHVRRTLSLPEEEAFPVRHAFATFLAFAAAGVIPLGAYLLPGVPASARVATATLSTFVALFGVGALRSTVTDEPALAGGLEMLGLGAIVAGVAYYAGSLMAWLLGVPG
jgi:VIT1/CCC1 family predicted Fe2+/Mn2+ transporter